MVSQRIGILYKTPLTVYHNKMLSRINKSQRPPATARWLSCYLRKSTPASRKAPKCGPRCSASTLLTFSFVLIIGVSFVIKGSSVLNISVFVIKCSCVHIINIFCHSMHICTYDRSVFCHSMLMCAYHRSVLSSFFSEWISSYSS